MHDANRAPVEARVSADRVEVHYSIQVIQTMPRLRKEEEHRVDYRHVVGWLVRKPGAFARDRYREDPCVTFRRAYDRLQATHGERADVEYLRILQLAATVGEQFVGNVVKALLDAPAPSEYVAVQTGVSPKWSRFRRSSSPSRISVYMIRCPREPWHEPREKTRHRRRPRANRAASDSRRCIGCY
jgi:hypothetical protein